MDEPVFEKSLNLPFRYVITARLRPSTIKSTALHLLPWALYMAAPGGSKLKTAAFWAANRAAPLMKQKPR